MKPSDKNPHSSDRQYWRLEGSLLELTTVRPIAFFTWNAQTFTERWVRRGIVLISALLRPLLYALDRHFATRIAHTILRGISRDRLDSLGEEYFEYKLKPYLKAQGVEEITQLVAGGTNLVLISQGLDHVMRPLAQYLGVKWIVANRLEFRDGIATGRLLDPVVPPRGLLARFSRNGTHGSRSPEEAARDLRLPSVSALETAVQHAARDVTTVERPIVYFDKPPV
ncbi:MAG: haloacid dehalogenase-like hydrolase, partial [Acidobacteriales bacterium]|nr:haloacid dehalogenase-like hydrolase [Terriglobales bacterium]